MTIFQALALLPLAAALGVLLRLRVRGRWLVALPLGAAAIVIAIVPYLPASERLVVIVDDDRNLSMAEQALRAVVKPGVDVAACTGVAIVAPGGVVRPADGGARWTGTCAQLGDPDRVVDANAAIQRAYELFLHRSAWQRMVDFTLQRGLRVVVIETNATRWRESGWSIDVAAEVARFRHLGVAFDLITAGGKSDAPVPRMRIEPHSTFIPLSGTSDERFQFDVVFDGMPVTAGGTITCGLDAECLSREDCADGGECNGGRCSTGSAKSPVAPWFLATRPISLSAHDNTLRTTQPVSLRQFETANASRQLDPGWHALRCKAALDTPSGPLAVERTQFYSAREGYLYLLWGDQRALRLDTEGVTATVARDVVSTEILGKGAQTHDALVFGDHLFEADVLKTDEPIKDKLHPEVLVVNDAKPELWKKYCDWIVGEVKLRGMSLIASGAPPEASCKDLPVYAEYAAGDHPVLYDRRPHIVFVLDDSRLGALQLAATSPPKWMTADELAKQTLPDGYQAQLDAIDAILDKTPWHLDRTAGKIQAAVKATWFVEPTLAGTWRGHPSTDPGGEVQMASASSIVRRLPSVASEAKAGASQEAVRLGIDDLYVVFAYDIAQGTGETAAPIKELLAQGAHVVVVPITTPFAAAFTTGPTLADAVEQQRNRYAAGPLASESTLGHRVELAPPIRLAVGSAKASVGDAATKVRSLIAERGRGGRMQVAVSGLGRFLDERIVPPGKVESVDQPIATPWGAPLLAQRLTPRKGESVAPLLELVDAKRTPDSLQPIPLGYAAILGRGHVLFLAYSIFEGALDDWHFADTAAWANDETKRMHVPERPNAWGPQRILDLARLTSGLEPLPTPNPRIVSMQIVGTRFVEVEVMERMRTQASSEAIFVVPEETIDTGKTCADAAGSVRLQIQKLDPDRHAMTLTLLPSQRRELCGGAPCAARLCRDSCERSGCESSRGEDRIFFPQVTEHSNAETTSLSADAQVAAIARYTGGTDSGSIDPTRIATRLPAIIVLGGALFALWSRASWKRLRRRRAMRTLAGGQTSDPSPGLVRQIGESVGEPSADVAAGAFAGYRPFDPGDKLRSAVLTDVVLMAGMLDTNLAVAPRIVQRIDERSRRVRIVVNIGPSTRIPASGLPKLQAVARVAEVIGEIAWSGRSEVIVQPVGVARAELFGPTSSQPSAGAVGAYLLDPVLGKESSWRSPLGLPGDVEDGETVVYVSDLLNEDLSALARRAEDLETDGVSVAFVHVSTPEEMRLTDMAIHPGSWTISDRSDWSTAELVHAHEALVATLDSKLGEVRGGFLSVSGALGTVDLIEAIRNAAILGVLR